ncbi:Gcd10p family-domain-containing protein [Xylariomycetidae sp. FL0641]|nr:Gcd10p family-domain-containing protein [Xylariomycetidae sp. FL0641]
MHSLVQPNAWAALKLPSGNLKVLQVTPDTTISLGKYGSFPSNLILQRPFHLTYELLDRKEPETFNRLRIVPASELYSDILTSDTSNTSDDATPVPDGEEADAAVKSSVEYSLVDEESGAVVAKADPAGLAADVSSEAVAAAASSIEARQTLTSEEIETLKQKGLDAGRDLIARLMLSHTAIDQKTQYSLAKYKLLKTKKYIRRFTVLPLDAPLLNHWILEEKDASKIMDMREEMVGLLGCWANVHFGGEDSCEETREVDPENSGDTEESKELLRAPGRWLVVDDTGGVLIAAMAERMGFLYPPERSETPTEERAVSPKAEHDETTNEPHTTAKTEDTPMQDAVEFAEQDAKEEPGAEAHNAEAVPKPATDGRHRSNDLQIPFAASNTMTLVHTNTQPNLAFLRYFDYDHNDYTSPSQPAHPLSKHLLSLSWLQLLEPQRDIIYSSPLPAASAEDMRAWKSSRRGAFHRKRRRWARTKHVIDSTRAGGFAGLVVASSMDPISVLKHTVPLLAGGAPIAVYSQSAEPLAALADCYSVARRAAWVSDPPPETEGQTPEQLERWRGSDEFPLNPTLVLGAAIQTARVRKWQVLPDRTHPLMTSRGGAEGYVFTGWRVKPAEGKVEARGKGRPKKRKAEEWHVIPIVCVQDVTTLR